MEYFGNISSIEKKSINIDLVTEADKKSEDYLIKQIRSKYPNHSIVSEEFGNIDNKSEYLWIIDPLDGTTNFTHNLPIFAVSLGLVKNNKESICGVVYNPAADKCFYAEKNKGAYLNNQRLRVSNKSLIDECLFSSNHEGVKFSNLNMRYTGCAALDLAYVSSGRLDGFFHNNINIWDVAAGALLVKEAGGIVNDIKKFNKNDINIKASSSAINDEMLKNLENF